MNNYDVLKLVNTVAGKDEVGQYQVDKFNTLLRVENRNLHDHLIRRYDRDWKARLALRPFLSQTDNEALQASGSVTTSSNFAKIVEVWTKAGRFVEIIDNVGEWSDRLTKSIKAPSTTYPIARMTADGLEVRPLTINKVDIWYIRYPTDPYLDGYIDGDGNFNYLSAGEDISLSTASMVAIDGTTLDYEYDSRTVELEWNDEEKIEIASRILGDMGVSHNKGSLVQYAQMMQSED
jgi:hypothetical protein